jgi:hypothetical protein
LVNKKQDYLILSTNLLVLVLYLTQIILNFKYYSGHLGDQVSIMAGVSMKNKFLLDYILEKTCLLVFVYITGHILYNLLQQQSVISPVICAFWINTPVSPARVLVSVLCLLLNLLIQPLKIYLQSCSKSTYKFLQQWGFQCFLL